MLSQDFLLRKEQINQFINSKHDEIHNLEEQVVLSKNWMEQYPNKSNFLLALLENLQKPHIEFFNRLFTALKHDVLYSHLDSDELDDKANKVLFKPLFKNDKMNLKILAQTPDGNEEKITSGGEKNVIATGLRLLALWRLISSEKTQSNKSSFSHRSFAFMDEPDCWISNKALPHYINLLNQIVHDFKQQVLLVTHHNVELFKPYARVYQLTNNGRFTDIQLISEPEHFKNLDKKSDYLQSINLQNFKTLKNVELELSPYFTVLVGESMVGKSAIMESFNAIVNNDSDDTIIRHHEKKALVQLKIVNDDKPVTLIWERIKKTTTDFPQKVRYRLFNEQGEMEHEEYNSSSVPAFAEQAMKMRKIDGIDIHLGSQEDMNFLFSNNISDSERAKILSLGKESAYIHKMIDNLNQQKRQKQAEIKVYEKRYNQLRVILENNELKTTIDPNDEVYLELQATEEKKQKLANQINVLDYTLNLLEPIVHIDVPNHVSLSKEPISDKLKELEDFLLVDELKEHISKPLYAPILKDSYSSLKACGEALKEIIALEQSQFSIIPTINNTKNNFHLFDIEQFEYLEKATEIKVFKPINTIDCSHYDFDRLVAVGKEIGTLENDVSTITTQKKNVERFLQVLNEYKDFILTITPECPVCGSNLNNHKHD